MVGLDSESMARIISYMRRTIQCTMNVDWTVSFGKWPCHIRKALYLQKRPGPISRLYGDPRVVRSAPCAI